MCVGTQLHNSGSVANYPLFCCNNINMDCKHLAHCILYEHMFTLGGLQGEWGLQALFEATINSTLTVAVIWISTIEKVTSILTSQWPQSFVDSNSVINSVQ